MSDPPMWMKQELQALLVASSIMKMFRGNIRKGWQSKISSFSSELEWNRCSMILLLRLQTLNSLDCYVVNVRNRAELFRFKLCKKIPSFYPCRLRPTVQFNNDFSKLYSNLKFFPLFTPLFTRYARKKSCSCPEVDAVWGLNFENRECRFL